jgi:hypothetical protein
MSRLTQPGARSLSYFMLCREFGVRAIDGMVRGRILDLRWMDPVTNENEPEPAHAHERFGSRRLQPEDGLRAGMSRTSVGMASHTSVGVQRNASHSGTAIAGEFVDVEEDIAIDAAEDGEPQETFGPKVLPATPILRCVPSHRFSIPFY